jgi:hypothetical protein
MPTRKHVQCGVEAHDVGGSPAKLYIIKRSSTTPRCHQLFPGAFKIRYGSKGLLRRMLSRHPRTCHRVCSQVSNDRRGRSNPRAVSREHMASRQSSNVDWDATRIRSKRGRRTCVQTLTTAMGGLMDSKDPSCLRPIMSKHTRSKYVKGASALFAWHVSRGRRVIVLSPPPPGRFHPSGGTNYQAIEEPILKGGDSLVIEMVHPTVKGAESFRYQMWPADMTCLWLARFGRFTCPKHCWRPVKSMVTLRFRGDKESCRTHGTRDVSPVQATGSGLDVPNSTLRESEARRASKGDVQKTMPSKQRALKEGSVNEKGVKEAVKEEAVC